MYVRLLLHMKISVPINKNLQCHFLPAANNSPEFKYVISWVVRKAICLRRRFSQEVSSRDARIAPRTLDFSQEFGLFWCKVSLVFPRYTKNLLFFTGLSLFWKSLGFSQDFPSSDATCPTFFHSFCPIAPGILGFLQDFPCSDAKFLTFFHSFWPHCTRNPWLSAGFPSSDAAFPTFFHCFGPTAPRVLVCSKISHMRIQTYHLYKQNL